MQKTHTVYKELNNNAILRHILKEADSFYERNVIDSSLNTNIESFNDSFIDFEMDELIDNNDSFKAGLRDIEYNHPGFDTSIYDNDFDVFKEDLSDIERYASNEDYLLF